VSARRPRDAAPLAERPAPGTDPARAPRLSGASVPRPRSPARPAWKRVLQIVLGVLSLIVGVIGGFVPILQGWMFIGLGLVILAPVFPPARRLMVTSFRRWPKLRRAVPRKYRRGDPFIRDDVEFPDAESADPGRTNSSETDAS